MPLVIDEQPQIRLYWRRYIRYTAVFMSKEDILSHFLYIFYFEFLKCANFHPRRLNGSESFSLVKNSTE